MEFAFVPHHFLSLTFLLRRSQTRDAGVSVSESDDCDCVNSHLILSDTLLIGRAALLTLGEINRHPFLLGDQTRVRARVIIRNIKRSFVLIKTT